MQLPVLPDWDATKRSLHQAIQILRATRLLGTEPLPVELHYSTTPTAYGATTGLLSFGGELQLHYARGAVVYVRDRQEVFAISMVGHHQTSFFDAVFQAFAAQGLKFEPDGKKITETTPFSFHSEKAALFADVQWRMYQILAMVKGRMFGTQTPIALWPHGFDLSTLWFLDGMDEHKDPQINMGFSPGTPDIGEPYFYFYAWPVPEGLEKHIPDAFTWNTNWRTPGGMLPYSRFYTESNPTTYVADLLGEVYRVASSMLAQATQA